MRHVWDPIGTRKTLIADAVINHKSISGHKSLFLVPTILLVFQQSEAITRETRLKVVGYKGEDKAPNLSAFDVLISLPLLLSLSRNQPQALSILPSRSLSLTRCTTLLPKASRMKHSLIFNPYHQSINHGRHQLYRREIYLLEPSFVTPIGTRGKNGGVGENMVVIERNEVTRSITCPDSTLPLLGIFV